uniref:Chitin-binding type-2 domain-containing protein n=5 Tax=Parascaris univalens TaxID=6257 RepID=A0A915A493_PARUN
SHLIVSYFLVWLSKYCRGSRVELILVALRSRAMISACVITALVAWLDAVHVSMADAERGTGFCERRSDGTFTVGCISEFFVCSSSFAFVMFCPSGLFFDENVQKCLPRWYASACRGSGNVPLKMAPLAAALASVLPSAEPEESGFCAGRPDGRYNIGCISAYTACMNERAIAMECPSSLVLDEPSGECLDEAYVSSCGKSITTQTSVAAVAAGFTMTTPPITSTNPPIRLAAVHLLPISMFSCNGMSDGVYSHGCFGSVAACIEGQAVIIKCPDNLKYDSNSGSCLSETYVAECANAPTRESAVLLPPTEATAVALGLVEPSLTVRPNEVHPSPAGDACVVADGVYARRCSSDFVICISHEPVFANCPDSLVFDSSRRQCVPRCSMNVCGCAVGGVSEQAHGATYPTLAEPTAEAMTGRTLTVEAVVSDGPITESATAPTPSDPCTGRTDGMYSLECASHFLGCVGEQAMLLRCPEHLVYDADKNQCLPRHDVKECGLESTTTQASTVTNNNPENTTESQVCTNRADGMYSLGCSTRFVGCVGGHAWFLQCPHNMTYDKETNKCLARYSVRECGLQSPVTTEAPTVATPTITQMRIVRKGPAFEAQMTLTGFSCADRPDGTYSSGCSTLITACVYGEAHFLRCPTPLKYDVETEQCLLEPYIRECGEATTTTKTADANTATSEAVPLTVATTAMISKSTGHCRQHKNGIVAMRCSPNFVECIDGRPNYHSCDRGLIFNPSTGACNPKNLVRSCGIYLHVAEEAKEAY